MGIFTTSFDRTPVRAALTSFVLVPGLLGTVTSAGVMGNVIRLSGSFGGIFAASAVIVNSLDNGRGCASGLDTSCPGLKGKISIMSGSFGGFETALSGKGFFGTISRKMGALEGGVAGLRGKTVNMASMFTRFTLDSDNFCSLTENTSGIINTLTGVTNNTTITITSLGLVKLSGP